MEEEDCVVRLRGLPWSTKPEEIIKFLEGKSDVTVMIASTVAIACSGLDVCSDTSLTCRVHEQTCGTGKGKI